MTTTIELSAGGFALDGVPSVVLCSSVFPFRIPSEQWDHRLQLVQESGYGMIDLYVHWGFHEQVPGQIDLTSPERDLRRFLDLARARGLLVMARPGPYICSETDGGGLPWWLHGDRDGAPAALRTSDPAYLAAVDRWFDAVMPILADAQIGRGGPVALVQIENELDFFDCPDPEAYMAHLADRTRALGIEVPIIGCAGQGDLAGATGDAEAVVPTVNLYPSDTSATFDEETRYYAGILEDRDLPLMVTETNRMHRTLRREILAGARLVAPYLQTSGFDHLVLPSAGNWGDPGNLMTHDYDFGGYISPDGRRRPEYDKAIALAATLEAWGERLAKAAPVPLSEVAIEGMSSGGALALPGGGLVVGPAELTGFATPVTLRSATRPDDAATVDGNGSDGSPVVDAVVPAGACPFWALDVPLAPWGCDGTLMVATAELVEVRSDAGTLVLTFTGGPDAVVELELSTDGDTAERLRHVGVGETHSSAAAHPVRIVVREAGPTLADPEPDFRTASGSVLTLGDLLPTSGTVQTSTSSAEKLTGAEALGLPDGRVQTEVELSAEAIGVLLLGAADLVRCRLDGVDLGVRVPHGAPIELPVAQGLPHRLRTVAEIWGRANFDDARRPALHLGAGRGPGTVLEIREVQDVTDLWEVRTLPDRRAQGALSSPPLRDLGGWSSPNLGGDTVYGRSLRLPDSALTGVLFLRGLTHPVHVALDGGADQLVVPEAPVVVLPGGAAEVDVTIRAPHVPDGLLDRADLVVAAHPEIREIRALREAELAEVVTDTADDAEPSRWAPLAVRTGSCPAGGLRVASENPVLVRLDGEGGGGALLELTGKDVEVTVVVGGRRVSRHVLGGPAVAGGDPRRSWVPALWSTTGPVLLLVEATAPQGGIFEGVRRARTVR